MKSYEKFLGKRSNLLKKNKTREQTVLRVGIDLEDNTDEPQISLDLGRSPYDSPTMVRSGDKLGQLLSEVSAAGSHSQDSFAKVYAPYFKDLATVFQTAIEEKVKNLSKQ
jgi:hypothetical protein